MTAVLRLRSLRNGIVRTALLVCLCLTWIGCGSGGGSSIAMLPHVVTPPAPRNGSQMTVRILVADDVLSRTHRRNVQYISPDTLGVRFSTTGSGVYTTTLNVSPGAAACGGSNASPRTCSGTFAVAPGTYTVTADTYDLAPVSNAIPGTAHRLATGSVTGVTILNGHANVTTIYAGGVITTYNAVAFISVPGDGTASTVGFALNPQDYDNESITAGTNDPYSNPITLTLTETGGSGYATLKLNGASSGSSAVLTHSGSTVQVVYTGGGATGYSINIAISASGVATTNVHVSPLFLDPAAYNTGRTIDFSAATQTDNVAITEANAPGTISYSVAAGTGCPGLATAGAVTGSGASAAVVISAGSSVGSGCVFTVTDNAGTVTSMTVTVTNTQTIGFVTVAAPLPLPGMTEYSVANNSAPTNITAGSDGNMWFIEFGANKLGRITTSGTITLYSAGLSASPNMRGTMALGPDGNVWFAEYMTAGSPGQMANISPAGVITEYGSGISANPTGVCVGPDGNIWFTEQNSSGTQYIATITQNGGVIEYTGITSGANPGQCTVGADGNIWFSELGLAQIGKFNFTTHAITEYSAGITASSQPNGMALGPDGNIWFCEYVVGKIARITTSGTVTEFSGVLSSTSKPYAIVAGNDGAMWFTENGANFVGRITMAGVINQYTTPSAQETHGMGYGPDGSVWATEQYTSVPKILKIF